MAFAAAAVVGSRRGSRGRSVGLPFPSMATSSATSYATGINCATGIATCACTALIIAGTVALVQAGYNSRATLVKEYARSVSDWNASRADFASTRVDVVASVVSWTSGDQDRVTVHLNKDRGAEKDFRDTEAGAGLANYNPLKYIGTFLFGSYYSRAGGFQPLPPADTAPSVAFEFQIADGNGTRRTLRTQPWPLAYDDIVRPRTPNPDGKCRREQGGDWRDRQCHVVRRLSVVCVQVYKDSSGNWQLNNRAPDGSAQSVPTPGGDANDNDTTPAMGGTYGCDAATGWNPATYAVDPCYVTTPFGERCSQPPDTQSVTVILRSALDPFIHAQSLTSSTMDFGVAPETQRVYGITMLIVGGLLCFMPLLRFKDWYTRKRVLDEDRAMRSTSTGSQRSRPDAPPVLLGQSWTGSK